MQAKDKDSRREADGEVISCIDHDGGLDPALDDGPEGDSERPRDGLGTARRLWEAAAGNRWRLVVACLSAVLYVVGSLWAVSYSAGLVDLIWSAVQEAFAKGRDFTVTLGNVGPSILTYLGIWTVTWIFYSSQSLVMASFAERLNLSLREAIADKLNRLPLGYYDSRRPGETISRATNDLDKVSEVLQRGLLQIITASLTLVGAILMMLRFNVGLTGLFLIFVAFAFIITRVVARRTLSIAAQRQEVLGRLTSQVEEAYSGRLVIKSFGREDASLGEIDATAEELAQVSARADFMTNAVGPAIRFLVRLAQVFIGLLAGALLAGGGMSVGTFQAYFQYMISASEPLTQLSQTLTMLQGALAAAERVFSLLDEQEVEPEPVHPLSPAKPVQGRIAFEHVRFGYSPDHPLMRDVNLVAEPGEKVAIVGATGAGKTTLINLLMRFYEVDGGRITLDGVDTRKMTRADLRRQFGMVLQDAWLFGGTIAENIAYGKPDATREEIEMAAKAAHVDFFIRTLPHGYDTVLSDDTEGVSQGQRQLLTIARAMLCDPAILILDEATSSVDTRTEQAIVRAMEAIMENRTSFVIAHRLSTIVDADLILVMDHGTIIEQGTHRELLDAGGAYARLYRSQFA